MITAMNRGRNGRWPQKKLNKIVVVDTNVERLRLPAVEDANEARWFIKFSTWMLKNGPHELSGKQLLIGTVLSTEAITSKSDLLNALSALKGIQSDGVSEYIGWMEGDLTRRLRISPYTKLVASRQVDWPQRWEEECRHFFKFVDRNFNLGHIANEESAYSVFFKKSRQWFYLILPPPCANDLAGVLPLTLLPEAVMRRRIAIRPPIPIGGGNDTIEVLNPLMDIAVDQLMGAALSVRKSKLVVIMLKTIIQAEVSESSRVADFLEKRIVEEKLISAAKLVMKSGCPIDALLTLWVIHLFQWGSARLRNPTIGTIRAYVLSLIEVLYEKLHQLGRVPTDVSQEDWSEFFSEILEQDTINHVKTIALKSFHRFLVVQLGIDPVNVSWGAHNEDSIPRANVLWPHEEALAFRLIDQFTSDLRLRLTLAALLSLGRGNPVRIGDLVGLTTRCVNRDLGRLRIDIFHQHGKHKGKSDAARRPMDYAGTVYAEHINKWLNYREQDGEVGNDVQIFGDPNHPGKCYRLGLCLRLLNQILKTSTGDTTASFHMLRHTCISNELLEDLLDACTPTSIAASKKLAAKAGQRNDQTTYTSYFHFSDIVVRHWINCALSEMSNSASVVGRWIDCAPNTLTVAKARRGDQAGYLEMRLRESAYQKMRTEPLSIEGISFSHIKSVSCLDAETGFHKTLHILTALHADLKLETIAARNDTTAEHVVKVCRAVIYAGNKAVSRINRKRVADGANDTYVVKTAKDLINAVFCHFPITEPILAGPLAVLRATVQPSEAMLAAVAAWQEVKQRKYIKLNDPYLVLPLVSFLISAGVPASNFYISVALKDPSDPVLLASVMARADVLSALAIFERLSQITLQVVPVGEQKARPSLYLMLCRHRIEGGKRCSSAGSRTNRLHALMLALAVWLEISKNGV